MVNWGGRPSTVMAKLMEHKITKRQHSPMSSQELDER